MPELHVTIPIRNEQRSLEWLLTRLRETLLEGAHVTFVDDASTDRSAERIREAGFEVISHPEQRGCGPSVRTGLYAGLRAGFPYLAVMAGNGKDDPAHLGALLEPLVENRADLVQGSRYLPGGVHENMPLHRYLGTHAYSLAFTLLAGTRMTDATNGFRALRATLLADRRIVLDQEWLVDYEVESYLLFRSIQLGYRVSEVPVSKRYPRSGPYTKMRAFSGWWSHFRPALLLATRLRK